MDTIRAMKFMQRKEEARRRLDLQARAHEAEMVQLAQDASRKTPHDVPRAVVIIDEETSKAMLPTVTAARAHRRYGTIVEAVQLPMPMPLPPPPDRRLDRLGVPQEGRFVVEKKEKKKKKTTKEPGPPRQKQRREPQSGGATSANVPPPTNSSVLPPKPDEKEHDTSDDAEGDDGGSSDEEDETTREDNAVLYQL